MANPQVRKVEVQTVDEEGRQVTRTGNVTTQSNIDIGAQGSPHDLIADGGFDSGARNVAGANALSGKVQSQDSNTFSVHVDWNDADGNTILTSSPSSLSAVTDVEFRLIVRSPNFNLRVTDDSGAAQNEILGTAIGH